MKHKTNYVITVLITLLALFWLAPLIVVVVNCLKDPSEFVRGNFWELPKRIAFTTNFEYVWVRAQLGASFFNSVYYGIIGSFFAILFGSLAAFSLSVLKVKWRFFWFLLIYSGTVFPFQMYLIPLFRMFNDLNLYDTKLGMYIFYTSLSVPFCLFVLRNFFSTISKEILESARMDGSTDFRIFWKIYLPLARSPIAVLFLFQFTWIWNDLLFGLTFSKSPAVRPVMAGVASLQGMYAGTNMPAVLVAVLVASIPTLLLFSLLQKNFMQGLTLVKK
jgi:multiple sugar transport system permease protein